MEKIKYFVCADIHGFYDEWLQALKEKQFNIDDLNHKIILCGDAFDRGKQAVKVYEFLKELKDKNKLIYIKGNHESLLFDCVKDLKENDGCAHTHHYSNGTVDTVVQFMEKNIVNDVLAFITKNAIDYFETQKYIFVHGWIPIIENCYLYDADWRNESAERWEKSRWSNVVDMYRYEIYEPNKTIVCGHWHCSALWHEQNPEEYDEFGKNANFEPFINKNMIALDACTVHSHKVNVILLEDN